MKLLIASNNYYKVNEIKSILGSDFAEIVTLNDLKLELDVVEDGDTFFDNALKKAKEIHEATGYITLADDSGLEVYALDMQPGVYSARYSGDHNDAENNETLLLNMQEITDRRARFVTTLVLYYGEGDYKSTSGVVEGEILHKYDGANGFGYDPIFYSYELKKSFGNCNLVEKNEVSHRGKALRELKDLLK